MSAFVLSRRQVLEGAGLLVVGFAVGTDASAAIAPRPLSRALHEEVRFDRKRVTSRNWADYPILRFSEMPEVKLELIPRPDLPWSSAGEAGTVATAAALANAFFDATGARARRLPLAPDYVRSLL